MVEYIKTDGNFIVYKDLDRGKIRRVKKDVWNWICNFSNWSCEKKIDIKEISKKHKVIYSDEEIIEKTAEILKSNPNIKAKEFVKEFKYIGHAWISRKFGSWIKLKELALKHKQK